MKKRILWLGLGFLLVVALVLASCGPAEEEGEQEEEEESPILEFGELAADAEEAKWENELGRWKPATAIIDGEEKALTSRYFKRNTYVEQDPFGTTLFVFEWNEEGSRLSQEITNRLIDKPLAIFQGDETKGIRWKTHCPYHSFRDYRQGTDYRVKL